MGALTNKTLSATYQASNVFSYAYDEGRVGASYNLSLGGLGTNMASATATYVKVTSLHLPYPTELHHNLASSYSYRIFSIGLFLLVLLLLLMSSSSLLLLRWDWYPNFPR